MSENKKIDPKKNELGSITEKSTSIGTKANTSNESKQAKVVSISHATEKKKLALINKIIETTRSY